MGMCYRFSLLLVALAAPLTTAQEDWCDVVDITNDGVVGTDDLLFLLAAFGRDAAGGTAAEAADVNLDGIVATEDLLALLASFGDICDASADSDPVTTVETLAEDYARAMLDPFVPLAAISSAITFSGDLSVLEADALTRQQFDRSFAEAMASSLGDGSAVVPEMVVVDQIRELDGGGNGGAEAGRRRLQTDTPGASVLIEVLFHLLLPESMQSVGASLLTTMEEAGTQIEITVVGTNFVGDADSIDPPTILPAIIDCEGEWVTSETECSEPCGPNGARPQFFVVSRAEQNGGSNCVDAETLPEPVPCNTHVQCPVNCAGEWSQWGDCSLPCGNGTQTRNYVVLQEPQHGGAACVERDTSQSQVCNTNPCPTPEPEVVDCVGSWSDFSECSHTCGPDGLQQRVFAISQIASNGGTACAQAAGATESRSCNIEIQCPVDCEGEWTDFGPCSEVCGPGVRSRQFTITEAAQNGGSCPEAEAGLVQEDECDNLCPSILEETDLAPGPISLPVSGAFQLATLVELLEGHTHPRGTAIPVARSYNGNEWEGTMPSPVSFECTPTVPVTCSTTLPAGATYQLRMYDGSELISQDPKRIASRFLAQATFGPTLDEIDILSAETVEETEAAMEDWLIAQMEIEPTLHRSYLRRRVNYPAYNDPYQIVRDPCTETSAWVTFAFSKFDEGRKVDVSLNADGTYSLSVDGVVRTVVEDTKDIREEDGWSCFKRGFRTQAGTLDMPGSTATVEASVEACHQRCVSTDGCAFFNLNEISMECHLLASADSEGHIYGAGGPWRTGPADCSPLTYQYPPLVPHPGLENAGQSCWRRGDPECTHGACPYCGPNGFCCKFGRDINGCVTTDPAATQPRCILDPSIPPPPPGPPHRLQANTTYTICFVNEYEGGDVSLLFPGRTFSYDWRNTECPTHPDAQIIIGNPPVNLPEPNMFITQQLDGIDMVPMPVPKRDSYSLRNVVESCELPPNPTVFIVHGEKYYRYEPRAELVDNTVDNPHIETRSYYKEDYCPAAKPTFVNARGCVRQNSCRTPSWTEGTVTLSDDLMQQMFAKGQKYVYSLTGFSLDGFSDDEISPCSVQTRWKKSAGACDVDTPLDTVTLASLSQALKPIVIINQPTCTVDATADAAVCAAVVALEDDAACVAAGCTYSPGYTTSVAPMPILETPDIVVIEPLAVNCTTELNGVSVVGARLTLDGTCYEQVHPENYNVYDLAYLPAGHEGYRDLQCDLACRGRNPLRGPATRGETTLDITSLCEDGSCWSGAARYVRLLGVLGQEVEFGSLPSITQVPWLAELAGSVDISLELSAGVTESCGALGEVANDPAFGHIYADRRQGTDKKTRNVDEMLWPNAVLRADDQLRQRVAWALSQIYVIAESGYGGNVASKSQYYDILVRNAFGNFRNLVKEVAYSEPMSVMLTYRDSKSAAASGAFADENFARECIQLFTVGIYHLNPDGTFVLDDDGNRMRTYGVKDVASFARTWTGFVSTQGRRGRGRSNAIGMHVDSLDIVPAWRDASPKMDLHDGFIGDGYPLCVDLPKRPFLRKGFSYVYLGSTVAEFPHLRDSAGVIDFVVLQDPASSLFQALCVQADGVCTFPTEVTLARSLPCFGDECTIDRAPIVRVVDGSGTDAYYEAIEFACTRMPFFNDGQFMKYGAPYENKMSCADPRSDAAAPLCCSRSDMWEGTGNAQCAYKLERVTYATAAKRCEQQGLGVCQGSSGVNGWASCAESRWRFSTWMARTCSTQVQIKRDGRVIAVHAGELVDNSNMGDRIQPETVADVLSIDSKSVFDVVWSEGSYPTAAENCSSPSCTVVDTTCLCDVVAATTAVLTDSQRIPTVDEVIALPVGALEPTAYDAGEYVRCTSVLCNASDVGVWSRHYRLHEQLGAEIEEVNVALNKPTTASSNHQDRQDSWITDGLIAEGQYYSTTQAADQWVQVDLTEVQLIDAVRIYFNPDCNRNCQRHAEGATIVISDTPDFSAGTQCGDALTWASPYRVNLCDGISGRYVTARNSPSGRVLQIVELEVVAEAIQTADGYVYAPALYEFVPTTDELVYTEDTLFEVPTGDDGAPKFFKNQEMRVLVDDYSFRNPPTLIDYAHPTIRQAELETDAVLGHLTTHPSTPPFISKKLIQLLTSSNPSPRYVLEVATAFRTGEYRGRVYSGEYGDLAATISAILLDREARDATLDLDPAAGKIREPFLKLWHAIRSLEFVPNRNQQIEMPLLSARIGQQYHKALSVFGFFEPEFSSAGPVAKANLYAPEAEVLSTPFIIGYMNGISALVDNGLSSCNGGFGYSTPQNAPHQYMGMSCGSRAARRLTSDGVLTYEYQNRAGDVVSELALLLTDGREPPAIRAFWDRSQTQFVNAALNRQTNSSSPVSADYIVDGLTDDAFVSTECSGEQWVQVDLGDVIGIEKVNFYHKMHEGERMNGAIVLVSDTPDFTTGVQCAAPIVFTGDPVAILECRGVSGRYVTVQQEGNCVQAAEMEVIAVRSGSLGEPRCDYVPPMDVCHEVRCGEIGGCTEPPTCAPPTEQHEVDCCSETRLFNQFRRRGRATCAGDVWAWRRGGAGGRCQNDKTYAEAEAICTEIGARLCTAEELETDCTRNMGCGHDNDLIWSSTMQLVPLPSDPNGQAVCDAVTALEDDTACGAAGCRYTPRIPTHPVPSEEDSLPDLIKLFTFSSEFAATNQNVLRDHPRPTRPDPPSQNRPNKALIVMLLYGGADSWNMLVPHSGCASRDLYAEYAHIRGAVALPLAEVLPIQLHEAAPPQPCTTYAVHGAMPTVKQLWDVGQASWFANIGTLEKPLTRQQFIRGDRPSGLFGHAAQRKEAQKVQADNKMAAGVLGRIVDALVSQDNPYRSKVYSMYGMQKLVEGDVMPTIVGRRGAARFHQYDRYASPLQEMTGSQSDSIFADTYAGILERSLSTTQRLSEALQAVDLQGTYSGDTALEQVARVMGLDPSHHESERDVFMVGVSNFDTHNSGTPGGLLSKIDADLAALRTDLVAMGKWNSTTVVSISDFGRTITSNGLGTDHGWGGNNFILGGSVKGGHIHGQFPEDLNPATSDIGVSGGRGVLIPQTPWEGMWYGLAEWLDVAEDRIAEVVPNAARFPDTMLYDRNELFN